MNDDDMYKAAVLSFGPFADKPTPELLDLLCDEDEVNSHAAATALQRRGERVAFERGIELTRDDREYVRDNATFLLGQLGYNDSYPYRDETAPVLEAMLNNDPSDEVRAGAAAALGHLSAASTLDSLVRAVEDADEDVRYSAAFALVGMVTPEILPVIEKIRKDPDGDFADWGEIAMEIFYGEKYGNETVESLCGMLADAELDIAARKAVSEILTDRNEAFAWEQACSFQKSESAALRLNAPLLANGLGRSKETPPRAEVIGMLMDMLHNDPEAAVGDRTAEVLAEFEGDKEVLDSLIAAAPDPDWRVRWSVAFALSRHGEPEGVPLLEKLSKDPDERVADYARERLDWMQSIFRNRAEN
ncbi:MAG: HEAT repeat domain-containing protein [Proteobacteria bacterium]|nr:HEAT repeat domain-containing protein [Pseudomonadota bacterium]